MHMLLRVVCEAYDAEDATSIAHGLFEGVDAPLYRRSRPSASGLDPEGEGRTLC